MAKKLAVAFAAVLVIAFGCFLYFSPYWTLHSMRAAARAGDGAELAEHVDFPAVRQSVKAEIRTKIQARRTDEGASPFQALGAAFAETMAGPIVDAMVTPESLALMFQGVRPMPGGGGTAPEEDQLDVMTSYDGFDTFVVTIRKKGSADPPIGLILKRHYLFWWKLTAVRLP